MKLLPAILLLASIAAACRIGPPTAIGTPTIDTVVVAVDSIPAHNQIFHRGSGKWTQIIICDTTEKK